MTFLLLACSQQVYAGHMMGGGMMGGGMMGGGMMGQTNDGNDARNVPDSQSEQGQLYQRYCGQCHAPPSPSAHASREWPGVVARMKRHMVSQGKAVPDSEQFSEVLGYLQRHAR